MTNRRFDETLKPKNFYQAVKALPLGSSAETALLYLYQPIIGAQALALYLTLLGDAQDQEAGTHLDILNCLNIGLPQFINERKRLEGVGLLKSFVRNDPEFGDFYLYEVLEPLNIPVFFQDHLMSFLLLAQVGERRFQQLQQRYGAHEADLQGYQEISSSFSESYHFSEADFRHHRAALEATASAFQEETTGGVDLKKGPQLDWEFLFQVAAKKFIKPQAFTPEVRQKLALYHQLYGYSPLELVDVLGEAVSLDTGVIDVKRLESRILAQSRPVAVKQPEERFSGDALIRRKNSLLQQGYTEADWATIQEAETFAPLEYLEAIKEAKHSSTTKAERLLVQDLVKETPLTNSIINILINYVLVVENKDTLQRNFVEAIAANWGPQQFTTPEAAMKYSRERKKAQEQAVTTTSGNRKRNFQKQTKESEQLRDWSKYQAQADPDKQAELNRKMQQFLKEDD